MKRLKKHFKRLIRVYRLQKSLRLKKKQLLCGKADSKKQLAKGAVATVGKHPTGKRHIISLFGVLLVGCGFVVIKRIQKQYAEKSRAYANGLEEQEILLDTMDDFDQKNYDEASLEELEEALYRVENEINEVSAAIDSKIN